MNKFSIFILFLLSMIIGLGGGYWFATQKHANNTQPEVVMDHATEKKPLFYRNPMNPAITSPVPAKDNMGMDYLPVYADNNTGAADEPSGSVKIDPVTLQNMGVRTAIAERRSMSRNIRTAGRIAYNEKRITKLHPKTEGWIEKLYIDETGEFVEKNTILLSIYSPQLVTTEQEYLVALKSREKLKDSSFEDLRIGAEQLVKITRERLEFLDIPTHQIQELEKTRKIKKDLHIHSPFKGIVVEIGAREGQFVTPATELYMLADLSRIWVYADVYESELGWVRTGDDVEMQLTGIPGRIFKGELSYIYPYAEAKTRTIKVRLEFDNPDLLLKPDMFADITIKAQRQHQTITIPSEAVVRSGEREQVFVVREEGKFEPRLVKLGLSADGMVQVLEGIKAGEKVVTSSQFLIDSESKLREATAKMMEASDENNVSGNVNKQEMPMTEGKCGASMMQNENPFDKETERSMDATKKGQMPSEGKCGANMSMPDKSTENKSHGDHVHD